MREAIPRIFRWQMKSRRGALKNAHLVATQPPGYLLRAEILRGPFSLPGNEQVEATTLRAAVPLGSAGSVARGGSDPSSGPRPSFSIAARIADRGRTGPQGPPFSDKLRMSGVFV